MLRITSSANRRLSFIIIAGVAGALFASFSSEDFLSAPYPPLILVPEGEFVYGSSREEREIAKALDSNNAAKTNTKNFSAYDSEPARKIIYLDNFLIMSTPVTIEQYAAFIEDTDHPVPQLKNTGSNGHLSEHTSSGIVNYSWNNNISPQDRGNHPVVMVSWSDAVSYASWLSIKTGRNFRLPTSKEWEKAARGINGAYFPWGMSYDPNLLNSGDSGLNETTPVGQYPKGASSFGLLDAAGQVFEWTNTNSGKNKYIIKGGSWKSYGCGVCRPAAQRAENKETRNIITGFRLVDIGKH